MKLKKEENGQLEFSFSQLPLRASVDPPLNKRKKYITSPFSPCPPLILITLSLHICYTTFYLHESTSEHSITLICQSSLSERIWNTVHPDWIWHRFVHVCFHTSYICIFVVGATGVCVSLSTVVVPAVFLTTLWIALLTLVSSGHQSSHKVVVSACGC